MALIVGLTGQTGAGKSSVRDIFEKNGAAVIDADSVAHWVVDNELWCLVDIVEHFSCLVLNEKGQLDRRVLGRMVFSDKKKLQALNRIIFPYISKVIKSDVEKLEQGGAKYIVIDGATLIESGCSKLCDVLISVTAEENIRTERIIARDGISRRDAQRRVSAQHPEEFYTEASDFVLKNGGSFTELEHETENLIQHLFHQDTEENPEDED